MSINRLLIIIIILLIAIIGLSAVLLSLEQNKPKQSAIGLPDLSALSNQPEEGKLEQVEETQGLGSEELAFLENKTKPVAADINTQKKQEALNLARLFIERFGSYSTENYSSIESVNIFMTAPFRAQTEDWLKKRQIDEKGSDVFYSVMTSVRAINFIKYNSRQAQVMVQTQRQEKTEQGYLQVNQQEAEVDLANQAGEWKVNSVEWL